MFERPAFLDFGFSCRGVHSLARFFLVVLPLAGPSRPPPAAASAVPASRGGVCKIKDAGPIPLIAPLHCLACQEHTMRRCYPICTYLIFLRLRIIPLLPFQVSMLSNASF